MKIVNISDQQSFKVQFIKYGWEMQRSVKFSIPVFMEYERDLLDRKRNFFFSNGGAFNGFVALDSKRNIVGRLAAMVNTNIESEGKLGLIGLFQVSNDYQVAKALIDNAVLWLKHKNCTSIWGPMDFSIWNRYRFAVDSFDSKPLIGEPRNPPHYPVFFERYGFLPKFHWQSRLMDKRFMSDYIIKHIDQKEIFDKTGYREVFLNSRNQSEIIDAIYSMMCSSFNHFPAYSKITRAQFRKSFTHIPQLIDRECTRFIQNPQGNYIGFLVTMQDLADVIGAMRGKKNLSAKIKFKLTKNHSEIANIYVFGIIPGAIRDSIMLGRKITGKDLLLTHVCLSGVFNSILSSGKYDHAMATLMGSGTSIQNRIPYDPKTTRNYYLYELNLVS